MDAKSCLFYGLSFDIDFPYDEEENEDAYNEAIKKLDELKVSYTYSSDRKYLTLEETEQRFDWDYGAQPLEIQMFKHFDKSTEIEYKNRLRAACEVLDIQWDEKTAGWFVVCDYR